MSMFIATVNAPGYPATESFPPVFASVREAWAHLAQVRRDQEDSNEYSAYRHALGGGYSATVNTLEMAAQGCTSDFANAGLDEVDGTGLVNGDTPGFDSIHDLGLDYVVAEII